VSDRLEDFRRQRDLLRRHLEWLDREIAALEGALSEAPPAAPTYSPASPAEPTPERARISDLDAEAILAEYRRPPVDLQRQTRLGCFIYFGVALALLALFVAGVYYLSRRAHGH
jgi:hypothetical protein